MKKEQTTEQKFYGWIFAFLFGGLLFMWYNYLAFGTHIPFWKLLCIGAVVLIASHLVKPFRMLVGMLFALALVVQVLAWLSLVKLPLFH